MEKRQVLLICMQPLLSEGLQRIFQALVDVELLHLTFTDLAAVEKKLALSQPDVVVIAGEQEDDLAEHLISLLLNRCIDVPVIWVGLEDNQLHVYSSHTLPASSARLLDTVRQLSTSQKQKKKIPPNAHGDDGYVL